jgi:hypothetical protein
MDNQRTFSEWIDKLELEHGMAIFEKLCSFGKKSGKWQNVRFQDRSEHSQEKLSIDSKGKAFIKAFNQADVSYGDKAIYPFTAFLMENQCTTKEALESLVFEFYGEKLGEDLPKIRPKPTEKPKIETVKETVDYLPAYIPNKSMQKHEKSNLFQFCKQTFGEKLTFQMYANYQIGTDRAGNTIYWYLDHNGFRAGKSFEYDPSAHKINGTIKFFTDKDFALFEKTLANKKFKPCLFGEHLLLESTEFVFLFESEKTAAFCYMAFLDGLFLEMFKAEQIAFLATGGANSASVEKLECLTNRTVYLVNDCDWAGRLAYGIFPNVLKGKNKEQAKQIQEYLTAIYTEIGTYDGVYSRQEMEDLHLQMIEILEDKGLKLEISENNLVKNLMAINCDVYHWDLLNTCFDKYDMGDYVVDKFLKEQWETAKQQERMFKAYYYALDIFAGEPMLLLEEIQERIEKEKKFKAEKVLESLLDFKIVFKTENAYFGDIYRRYFYETE